MADEIRISASIQATKGTLKVENTAKTFTADLTGTDYCAGTQIIGTAEEAVTVGEVGTPGWCYLENLDATDSITVVFVTGQTNGILLAPGESALFKKSGTGLFAFSSANTPTLKKVIIEA